MKNMRWMSAIAVATLAMSLAPANAQTRPVPDNQIIITNQIELNRAKNRARQAATEINGGLSQYRAESSMHGPASEAPFVDNRDGTWTFTFKGRRPNSNRYTIETVVTVSRDGRRVNVDYNGPIRQSAN